MIAENVMTRVILLLATCFNLCVGLDGLVARVSHAKPLTKVVENIKRLPGPTVQIPLSERELETGTIDFSSGNTNSSTALLRSLVTWIAANFDLPANYDPPNVKLSSPAKIAALRNWDVPGPETNGGVAPSHGAQREVVSVYDPATRTIYLRDDWRGRTPAELSILVHEMVHHLQTLAGLTFACPQEREQLAYQAQNRWLQMSGRDLASEFEIDPMTLLLTTKCFY
jgi:hypothetical protein